MRAIVNFCLLGLIIMFISGCSEDIFRERQTELTLKLDPSTVLVDRTATEAEIGGYKTRATFTVLNQVAALISNYSLSYYLSTGSEISELSKGTNGISIYILGNSSESIDIIACPPDVLSYSKSNKELSQILVRFTFTGRDELGSEFAVSGSVSIIFYSGSAGGSIVGRITNATTGDPLANVAITTSPETSGATTDSFGDYFILDVEPGSYIVKASKDGYAENTTTVTVVAGEPAVGNIELTPF